ncbi:MAG: DNA polymerase/3'-5' exonuclease PolX, partial [Candidatus Latescibacteria bacterium]|nr:DNA polymerase/3'-5' exonuclease PolX [Candidatus Latescibacterota bacterium]
SDYQSSGINDMKNKEIAKIFEHIGKLLELKGENPFKVRAYYNAARTINNLSSNLGNYTSTDNLKNIKGIGNALAEKIIELISTGTLEYLNRLESEISPEVIEMLQIPGLGVKKVRKLVDELGVQSIGELEYACFENRIKLLDGFGQKSQEKILQGIDLIRSFHGHMLYSDAEILSDQLLAELKMIPGFIYLSTAGSLRRCCETVEQLVFIASISHIELDTLENHLILLDSVKRIIEHENNKVTIGLYNDFICILKFFDEEYFPAALYYNTGSVEHVASMNVYAKKNGYEIKDDGLYHNGDIVTIHNEQELFDQLNMAFIPPEIRENTDEIEAACSNGIPALVEDTDIRGIFHIHTVWSDGSDSIAELAKASRKMGMEYIGISDHSVSAGYAGGLSVERLKAQWDEIDAWNETDNGIYIFKGIESDILGGGALDYDERILDKFDFVIVSVHSKFNMSKEEATERIIRAISHPSVTMLGHPTGRLLLARKGYPVDIERVLESCVEHGVAVELNANPRRLDLDWRYLRLAASLGVKISINPDAHDISSLSQYRYGVKIARKGWLAKKDILNTAPLEKIKIILSG